MALKDLKIELYLTDSQGHTFDLIRGDVALKLGEFKMKSKNEYIKYSLKNKTVSKKKRQHVPVDMQMEVSIRSEQAYQRFAKFMNQYDDNVKITYSNKIIDKEIYAYCDIEEKESVQYKRTDERIYNFTITLNTYWINEVYMDFGMSERPTQVNWVYGQKRPVIYSNSNPDFVSGQAIVVNDGHEASPFKLQFDDGATYIHWWLTDLYGNIIFDEDTGATCEGYYNHAIAERFWVDTLENKISTDFEDLSYLREHHSMCFFDIPIGTYILNVEGAAGKLEGTLYEFHKQR